MGHHHLLQLILALILLILPSSSHATTKAMFSAPLQFLFGGRSLTDGDLALSLSNDCSLILYKAGIPVINFNTSTTTLDCALILNQYGRLLLVPDNEETRTQAISTKTYTGQYALLFVDGKLGIFGPAMWNNGVPSAPTFFNPNHLQATPSGNEKLKTATTDYILFSDNTALGSANGDVVIARNGKVSTVITKRCTLAVKDDTTNKTIWQTGPASAEPRKCFLGLESNGELLLQWEQKYGFITQWKGGYAGKEKLYVCLLRSSGQIIIYGLKTWLYDGSSSAAAIASAVVVDDENIEMVTA